VNTETKISLVKVLIGGFYRVCRDYKRRIFLARPPLMLITYSASYFTTLILTTTINVAPNVRRINEIGIDKDLKGSNRAQIYVITEKCSVRRKGNTKILE
jgi:hypothetical protein